MALDTAQVEVSGASQKPDVSPSADQLNKAELSSILTTATQMIGHSFGYDAFSSIIYDWPYFHTIDGSRIQFLSLNDHITNALEWVPLTVPMNIPGLYLNYRLATARYIKKPDIFLIGNTKGGWIFLVLSVLFVIIFPITVYSPMQWGKNFFLLSVAVSPLCAAGMHRLGVPMTLRKVLIVGSWWASLFVTLGNGRAIEDLSLQVGPS